jgi:propionyl-CoA synthetase
MKDYHSTYAFEKQDRETFWLKASKSIDWITPPKIALDDSNSPFSKWFPDGKMNSCFNAVDRHVLAGRQEQTAIQYESPITGQSASMSYGELKKQTEKFAGMLNEQGLKKGDRVIIYMPMIKEAVIAMLGCARIGVVHSVVFGGFAAAELAKRINDCKPKLIVSASCGHEPNRLVHYKPLLDQAIQQSKYKPSKCIIYQRDAAKADLIGGRDIEWYEALASATPANPVALSANDPLYILYTSGTTGQPKGVVRDNGGHAVALCWSMSNIYDVNPGEVFWAASDIGWVVGHSYIVYAPLFAGCTSILYEGKPVGTPDAGAFWSVVEKNNVKTLFKHDISSLKYLFLAGERADPDTISWAQKQLRVPIIDHWWQTETGWSICANPVGLDQLPIKIGSPSLPMPGFQIEVLDDSGNVLANNVLGSIVIKLPLPPSCLTTIWGSNNTFVEKYLARFPGYYETGDAGYLDDDGYIYIMARTDDIINVAGHRLSTGQIEEVISEHPDVAECAVIGINDELKGQIPISLVCLYPDTQNSETKICEEIVQLVINKVGRVSSLKKVVIIDRLPKTRSGKIVRSTMVKIANHEKWMIPATIEDATVLDEISRALEK